MSNAPIHVLMMFGGQSAEHLVSIRSAQAILKNLSKDRYQISLVYIHPDGAWSLLPQTEIIEAELTRLQPFAPLPWSGWHGQPAFDFAQLVPDIVFPILHGPNGEDGRLQGFLQMHGIPFVGCSAVGSMLAMDKGLSKLISAKAGLPVVDWQVFHRHQADIASTIMHSFTWPVFVKPCNLGSSVGISKVNSASDLSKALELAFTYDERIIVEQGILVREIELSAMGKLPDISISKPGELVPHNEFYDYNDKYIDDKTRFSIPAQLTPTQVLEACDLAKKAYEVHQLDGYARVDLFLHKETGRFYLNELNTIPGFTEISMFPKLWQLDGLSFSTLLDKLIDQGMCRPHKPPQQ